MAKRKTRSDGRYQGKILVGVIDGRQKYKYVYGKTKKEVDEKLAALRVELGKGADLTQNMSLSFWIDRWLSRLEQAQTPDWHAVCRVRAEYWRAALGDRDVSQLNTADLEDVLLGLKRRNPSTGKPSSKKTLTEYRNIICRIFAFCRQARVLTFDPSEFLTVEKNASVSRREAVSDDVIQAIRSTPCEAQLPCLIMIYAGLRLGEVCALTWTDVDLDNDRILVNKSYNFKACAVKSPKTAAGTRTVPIPPPLHDALSAAPHVSLLVCPHRSGRIYTRSGWDNVLTVLDHKLAETHPDFPPLRAHNLRHTCCTLYYEAGIDVLTAQKWMGHANPQTTIGIYTHLREQKEASNVTRLNAFFSPQKPAEKTK